MVSDDELARIMPNLASTRRAEYLPSLQQAMNEFEVDTPLRAAAFLARSGRRSSSGAAK